MRIRLIALVLFALVCRSSWAEEPAAPDLVEWKVRVVDEQGQPVADAEVGLSYSFTREEGWHFTQDTATRTNAQGECVVKSTPRAFEVLSLSARKTAEQRAAFANLPAETDKREVTLTLVPARRVLGKTLSAELTALGETPGRACISIYLDGRFATEHWGDTANFEALLVPGIYEFEAVGSGGAETVRRRIEVPAGEGDLVLEPFDLPASRLRNLQGQPAPELPDTLAWKNSKPLKLADLRGKPVLLDFWGWWCGACVHNMPKLFELHDRLHERGLVIIGVHVDYDDVAPTVTALDAKLQETRRELWKDRDVPYPVALYPDKPAPHMGKDDAIARSHVSALYGVRYYPTYILIDPEGRVAGQFGGSDEDLQRLEAMLPQK
jgi:thiol-disulfide isomerase/thioredoxin